VPRKGLTYDRGVGRFVYISGAGADPTSDRTWYRAKGLGERALRGSGLDWVAVRPSWAYGPGDKAINRLAQIARFSPVVPRLGVTVQRIQPIFVGDIALAVSRILETPEAWNRVFELGGPEIMTMQEVIHTMLDVLGKRRAVLPIPAPLAKLGTAPLVLTPKPFMTPQGIEFAIQDGLVDTTDAKKILGLQAIPLTEGLRSYEIGR
jgi:NADH dehydrogenase